MKRILISIVTYDGHRYAFERLVESIAAFTYRDFDVLFVDNSKTDEFANLMRGRGCEVIKDRNEGTGVQKCARGREMLRRICLERGYEYMFSLDADVICPPDILDRLLAVGKPVATGYYLHIKHRNGIPHVMPVLFVPSGEGKIRYVGLNEVFQEKVIPIAGAGLGATLIHRDVLATITFRCAPGLNEDAAFFGDVIRRGITPYADLGAQCLHFGHPEGDPRNEVYKFENHRKHGMYAFPLR